MIQGDIGAVHVGEEGEGEGGSVNCNLADDGVEEKGVAGDRETEEHGGGVTGGVGG